MTTSDVNVTQVWHSGASFVAFATVMSVSGMASHIPLAAGESLGRVSSAEVRPPQVPSVEALGVELRELDALREIVDANPGMLEVLAEAIDVLKDAFGGRASIALEPLIDPENPEPQPRIFVIAVTSMSFEQADGILDGVLDGWWAENQNRVGHSVFFTTEFV
jgi:hypothetical protein